MPRLLSSSKQQAASSKGQGRDVLYERAQYATRASVGDRRRPVAVARCNQRITSAVARGSTAAQRKQTEGVQRSL